MVARDVLAGEAAEGRPLEVLASEDEVGRRPEDEDQPLHVLAGEEAKGRQPKVLAGPARTRSAGARRARAGRRTSPRVRCDYFGRPV